jgi:hypothetical protein
MTPDRPLRPSFDWRPTCPACRYDLEGLPDGPCPECGHVFRFADLVAAAMAPSPVGLTKREAAAVVRFIGWATGISIAAAPTLKGLRTVLRACTELSHGCHWTNTDFDSPWMPQTSFSTCSEALAAGILWIVVGLLLGAAMEATRRFVRMLSRNRA